MEKFDEPELLRRAQQGDQTAREALYSTFFSGSKSVQGLLAKEVPAPEDREDILHDAYLSLIRSKVEFRGDSRLQTFVYRVVQITILQKLRKDRARRRDKTLRLTYVLDGEEQERELPVTDYEFEAVDARKAAERMFQFLPEPLRTAFRMRVSDEMSYEEIAQATSTPVNTVATRIFKARAALARLFGAPERRVE